jgi:hypothetical protein
MAAPLYIIPFPCVWTIAPGPIEAPYNRQQECPDDHYKHAHNDRGVDLVDMRCHYHPPKKQD